MARFSDYVKEDQLDTELVEADVQEQAREEAVIPERFKGKSAAEIAASYIELERLNSRQAQDLGSMRKTVDTLLELQSNGTGSQAPKTEEPSEPVTVDLLYEKPDETVRRVVREETSGQLKEVKGELAKERFERALAEFDRNHEGWRETTSTPEFLTWAQATPYRARIFAAANTWDFDAADTLLGLYNEEQARGQQSAEAVRKEQRKQSDLRKATLESSGPVPVEAVETFSRSDLINKKLAAKRGDYNADQYLRVNADAIRQAYADGRVTD
jgi:ribosomal protein L29